VADREEIPAEEMMRILQDAAAHGQIGSHANGWTARHVIGVLGEILSADRRERIARVVNGRTRTITTVVEGIVNTGNVSAVMRTAEALGFQDFHVIKGDNRYKHSVRTTQGAQKWLDVHLWDTATECIRKLRSDGYHIVVTQLDENATDLMEIDFTKKTAVVFGNEVAGASEELLGLADQKVVIPSTGFVQSFNISVAAAMTLHKASLDRTHKLGQSGDLTEEEKETLTAEFYFRAVNHASDILKRRS
jgi:tRNA (guanosine-2'-O-)-methyltransferase